MRRIHLVFLAAAAVTLSCSDNNPIGSGDCSANDDCQSGEVCDNGDCVVLCVTDADCAGEEICTNSLCGPGQRVTPTLTQIDGDDVDICPDAGGSHCVAAGLVVQGTNLEGASFELVAAGGTNYPLTPRGNLTDTRVELDLPTNVGLGIHTLRAVNGAGSADQNFEFIQGPQGVQGAAGANGSPDTGAEIMLKLQSVDGSGSGLDADTLDGAELADINATVAAVAVPIGTILAWHKDLDAGIPALPAGWMECNGQQVQDSESPLEYAFLPDLNSELHSGTGRGTYLRGGLASGVTNASTTFGPNNSTSRYTAGTGVYNGAAYHRVTDADNTADAVTYVNGTGAPVFRFQVAAMTVVWIIRVK
jgi:hypothetical protein